MAIPAVGNAAYPTPEEQKNQILSDYLYNYAKAGIEVNVEKGTELEIKAEALANRLSPAVANGQIAQKNLSPKTATETALDDICDTFGVERRPAAASAGNVTVTFSGTSLNIPAGFTCESAAGVKYETTGSVTLSPGPTGVVEVRATTKGASTNLTAGSIVTWNSASIGALQQTATVGISDGVSFFGDITGGADEDDDEELRERLIQRLSFPAVGGNWAQIVQWAEDSSSSVDEAYVYESVRGPSSYDVAVVGTSSTALSASTVAVVASYILARMPGSADLNATAVTGEGVDVVIDATLPLPVSAGGAGGGWKDAVPWPSSAEGATVKGKITAVDTGAATITVNSTSGDPPSAGKRFAVWNPTSRTLNEYAILSVSGSSGAYVITIDTSQTVALSALAVNLYCSPAAANMQAYTKEFYDAMLALGPGEKTTNTDILPRGRRQPGPDVQAPAALTSLQLAAISDEHPEVLDLAYAARYATGTTTNKTTPSIPATTADPPFRLTSVSIAFRRQV